jgi:hypothetical protein
MSGWDAFQIATTLFRSGAHDQKVSVTLAEEDAEDAEDGDDEDAAPDADVVGVEEALPWEEQPAATSEASAAAAIAVTRTRRVPRRGERITAGWPPSKSFMAPPKDEGR